MLKNSHQDADNRFGPFRGAGNELGLVPEWVPGLGTHLVPWLRWTEPVGAGGRPRLRSALRPGSISRGSGGLRVLQHLRRRLTSSREVIEFIAGETGSVRAIMPAKRLATL